jgi:hypothetical protein
MLGALYGTLGYLKNSQHVFHFKCESENSSYSSNFRGEEI